MGNIKKAPPPPLEALGLLVRETRIARGLTQQRAANDAGVSRKQWALLEKGQNASAVFIQKVATFLELQFIPLGGGLEASTAAGRGFDVTALLHLADELVAVAAVIADRLRSFAVEASLPASERGDAQAIAALVARGDNLAADAGTRLSRTIHKLAADGARRSTSPPAPSPQQTVKRRKRRA